MGSQLADGGGEQLIDTQALHTLTRETSNPEFTQRKMFQAGRYASISRNPSHLSRTSMLVQPCDEFAIIRVNRKGSRGDILSLSPHSPFVLALFSVPDGEGPRETLSGNPWVPRRMYSSGT